jgi:hypothetical protein
LARLVLICRLVLAKAESARRSGLLLLLLLLRLAEGWGGSSRCPSAEGIPGSGRTKAGGTGGASSTESSLPGLRSTEASGLVIVRASAKAGAESAAGRTSGAEQAA